MHHPSRPAIVVDRLSKAYRIGRADARHSTFREAVAGALRAPWRRLRELGGDGATADETFWALKDVSFEVPRGEVVGIIGRNGAGKSTLLKVLSRITEPTAGEVRLRGRVASLLEVGTGFHPELTGRENVYLNGSILGMKRAEIDRKFDEIVAFAEIEKFLDTPVKRYSSGMYVRLAFAVAAHLDPEILIVDEVLAVGDAEFQKKCLGKMRQVSAGGGRTVLFVSHNMNAVAQLCQRAVLLRKGELATQGPAQDVLQAYANQTASGSRVDLSKHPNRDRSLRSTLRSIELFNDSGEPSCVFPPGSMVNLKIEVHAERPIRHPKLGIAICNWKGESVFAVANFLSRSVLPPIEGDTTIWGRFELPMMVPGAYYTYISISDESNSYIDAVYSASSFEVVPTDYLRTTQDYFEAMGHIMVRSEWGLVDGKSP